MNVRGNPSGSSELDRALAWVEQTGKQADAELLIDSGTLLGLAREGELLPGDLDIDLALIDTMAIDRLVPVLRSLGARIWRYGGQPYRAELPAERSGLTLNVEVKFFQRDRDDYICPAVGFASPGGNGSRSSRGLRALLRPFWRQVLASGDAAHFPIKQLARVDFWRVPVAHFDHRTAYPGKPHCMLPRDVDGYLAYRYGDWRKPAADWVAWRDDGAYRATSERMRARQKLSPHRFWGRS